MAFKVFTGIDVSKLTLDVAILFPEKKKLIHRQVNNDETGFSQLCSWIKGSSDGPLEDVLICLEHTGVYAYPLCRYLKQQDLSYSLQSALHIKQSMGIKRGKTDKADAEMLARFAYLYKDEINLSAPPAKQLLLLRNLLTYRSRLIKNRTVLLVSAKELEGFTEREVHFSVLKDSSVSIAHLNASVKRIEAEISEVIKADRDLSRLYKLVSSVSGIGLIVAAHIIVYTKGFTAFDTWRKFACYCGIAPFEYSSGSSIRGKTKVSPIGNRELKILLGQSAANAIKYDKELSKFYQRKLSQGKDKMVALNIVKNKLVNRVFAVVRRGTPYVKITQP